MTADRYVVRPGPGGTRLAGHALPNEGRPRGFYGGTYPSSWVVRCDCGAECDVASAASAKRWHAAHKAEVAGVTP